MIVLLTSCVSSQSTLQTAPTVPKNKFRVTGGESIPVSTRFVSELTDVSGIAVDRARNSNIDPLTENEQQELIEAAIATALLQPTLVTTIEGRYGVHEKIDIGVRWSGPALRLDSKYWLYHKAGGLDVSFGLGLTYHTGVGASLAGKVYEVFDFVELLDFKRRDADASIYLSGDSRKRLGFYGSLRYTISSLNFESNLIGVDTETISVAQPVDEISHYIGGASGVRLRFGSFAILAELTVGRLFFDPTFGGNKRNLSGFVVEPALGANVNF